MAKLGRPQARAADGGGHRGKGGLAEDRPPQWTARPRAGEHQLVRLPAADVLSQLVDEERRANGERQGDGFSAGAALGL